MCSYLNQLFFCSYRPFYWRSFLLKAMLFLSANTKEGESSLSLKFRFSSSWNFVSIIWKMQRKTVCNVHSWLQRKLCFFFFGAPKSQPLLGKTPLLAGKVCSFSCTVRELATSPTDTLIVFMVKFGCNYLLPISLYTFDLWIFFLFFLGREYFSIFLGIGNENLAITMLDICKTLYMTVDSKCLFKEVKRAIITCQCRH